jgi:hypothetical protein
MLHLHCPFWGFLHPHRALFAGPGLLPTSPCLLACPGCMWDAWCCACTACFGHLALHAGPILQGAGSSPTLLAAAVLMQLVLGFSFHPAAAILQAGGFPQPPGFSHGWHAWSCSCSWLHHCSPPFPMLPVIHPPCAPCRAKSSCMHLVPFIL